MIRFVNESFDGKFADVTEEEKQQNNYSHIIIPKGNYKFLKEQLLEEAHKEVRTQEDNLNRSLLRIMRERANAGRKLSPKKEHSGYTINMMQQTMWTYKKGQETVYITLWRSLLQTPYDASLPFDCIHRYMIEDLENGGVLSRFGCNLVVQCTDKEKCIAAMSEHEEDNVAALYMFRANYKSNLWETEVFSSKPLVNND